MRRGIVNVVVLVVTTLIMLLLAEGASRLLFEDTTIHDARYGWVVDTPAVKTNLILDHGNATREITVEYFAHGFKRWGDVRSAKPKVLIVGDSFTEMAYVSNGEEWYAALERAFPDIEWFVYGAAGFGSVQELFLIEDYFDTIRPDAIIVQTHYNDFINNDYQAEKAEYPFSNTVVRPYLERGEIVYRMPVPYAWLRLRSRLFQTLLEERDRARRDAMRKDKEAHARRIYGERYLEHDFSQALLWRGRFPEVLGTTKDVFARIRARVGDTPVYLFSADDRLRWAEEEVAASIGATYIPGVPLAASRTGDEWQVPDDGHWNLVGNELVGNYLARWFERNGMRLRSP